MGHNRRAKWLSVAARLPDLPPEEQARMRERMHDWAQLSPQERTRARIGFQAARRVDAEERRAKWEAYQALPPEKRAELAKAAKHRARNGRNLTPRGPGAQPKSNLVPPPPQMPPNTPVTASLVQAKPGATTVLITRPLKPPPHQEAGHPKVIADPELVDPKTLLPKSLKATPGPASN